MEQSVIKGQWRKPTGTAEARRQRRAGWIPANMYGHGKPNSHFLLQRVEVTRLIEDEHRLLTLDVEGTQGSGIVKEIQWDALGDEIVHLDFARVSLDEVIEAIVPIHTAGNAKGVGAGGILDMLHHEVPIKGKAGDLPERIEVEVSALDVGDAIRAKDLVLPEGIECLLDLEDPIVIVHGHEEEPEATEDEEDAGEGTAGA